MTEAAPGDFGSTGAPVAMPADVRPQFPWIAALAAVALHLAFVIPAGVFGLWPDPRVHDDAGKPQPIAVEMITEAALKAKSAPAPTPPPPAPRQPAPVDNTPLPQDLTIGITPPDTPPSPPEVQVPPLDLALKLPGDGEASAAGQLSQTLQSFQQALKDLPKPGSALPAKKGKIDTYTLAVRQSLARRMPAPPGGTGSVELTLVLSESGTPVDVKLLRTSGIAAFDAAAMNSVWSCACPKAPAGSTQTDRTIDVEFNF